MQNIINKIVEMWTTTSTLLVALVCLGIRGASIEDRSASPEEGTELLYVFMLHRHGDRTPESGTLEVLPKLNNDDVKAAIDQLGYGQLTNMGIETSYKLGEFIRSRYNGMIAPKYNDSEVYIRSSDVTRTKMTVLSASAAVYKPQEDSWTRSQGINWVPVPYTTAPSEDDEVLYIYNSCQKYIDLFSKKIYLRDPSVMYKHKDVLDKLGDLVDNKEIADYPFQVLIAGGTLNSLINMGYDIGENLLQLYPKLSGAFDDSWAFLNDDEDMVALNTGVLLNEFVVNADKIINGEETQKVRWYSAHDLNVYALETATKVNRQGTPKYGSMYSLELRRVVATGQIVVLPVYLADPREGEVVYLQAEGCDGVLCDYETFTNNFQRLDRDMVVKMCAE